MSDTTLDRNQATEGGGGIYCHSSSPTVKRCFLAGNTAIDYGGGLMAYLSSSPALSDCVFAGNGAANGAAGKWLLDPRNVEIKARLSDPEATVRSVRALATEGPVELEQEDTFFAVPRGA